MLSYVVALAIVLRSAYGAGFPDHQLDGRSTIVHLFEWKWSDIAEECESFLGPKGFGGVQISPPSENLIIHLDNGKRSWYERYQVMSYNLITRSGNEQEFLDMTTRCNKAGVRIYADAVINHMTATHNENIGTGGSTADFSSYSYPGVPYSANYFHYPRCRLESWSDANQVRNCELYGLKDLDQSQQYVREKIVDYMNRLIELGVAGFRIDAAKQMAPEDLKAINSRLNNLNTEFGFDGNAKPYIFQEVRYGSDEAVSPSEYYALGPVTEFKVGHELKNVFRGNNDLRWLVNWGESWGLGPSETAITFIDDRDTQRSSDVLTYKEPRAYRGALAFILAHPYGSPHMVSSYFFTDYNQGPPDSDEAIMSRGITEDGQCTKGWVCEHRWRQMYQMIGFRNAVLGTHVQNWWDNQSNQIAFSRGDKGFIAFNLEAEHLDQTLQTGLPAGTYCDIITGELQNGKCTGRSVTVNADGTAHIYVPYNGEDMMLAIHEKAKRDDIPKKTILKRTIKRTIRVPAKCPTI